MKKLIFYILVFIYFIIFFSCTSKQSEKKEESQVLATIGSEAITVDEFRKNYELGFANLKSGRNSKKSYLDYMLNEKLLSIAGYDLGLDKSDYVQKSVKYLKRELLIEILINVKVKEKIEVSPEEIKEYINKSKVQFKFRYWAETDPERAKRIALEMQERGYADVLEEILLNNPEISIDPKNYETDYLNHEQVAPDVLAAIKDLPYGEVSDPVELRGKYYIFQVLDIRRSSVTENEYMSRAPSVKQVIFYQKFEKALVDFGTQLMDSKNIKTKRKAFDILAGAITDWKKIDKKQRLDLKDYVDVSNTNSIALKKLSENAGDTFFEYNDGEFTIEEFLEFFSPSKFLQEFDSEKQFVNYLHKIVSQTIRDIFLIKEAKENDLDDNPGLQKELKLWENKFVYEEFLKNKATSQADKKNLLLNNEIEDLKRSYKIEINESILDTIKVIDFKKSKWASMQILRSGSNRPAYPVVDPRLEMINSLTVE